MANRERLSSWILLALAIWLVANILLTATGHGVVSLTDYVMLGVVGAVCAAILFANRGRRR